MAAVYVSNLVVNTGATFTQKFTLENVSSNSALDVTGYGVAAKMRKHASSVSAAATFTCSIADATGGVIQVGLSSAITGSLKAGRYQYDVIVKDSAGEVTRVVEGSVLVRKGVTREDDV
jgi:hypothetical protein|tara:strand:- start:215 stop:571 length:357 start_codon:yes stop_codon:yes gene_type:complete